jgi:hypothetical protein
MLRVAVRVSAGLRIAGALVLAGSLVAGVLLWTSALAFAVAGVLLFLAGEVLRIVLAQSRHARPPASREEERD